MAESQGPAAHTNGEVIIGDMEYDGRVILYIIKGPLSPRPFYETCRQT